MYDLYCWWGVSIKSCLECWEIDSRWLLVKLFNKHKYISRDSKMRCGGGIYTIFMENFR